MQVAHFAGVAALEPLFKMRQFRKLRGGSDAAQIESHRVRKLNRPRRRIIVRHGKILVGRASACLLLIFA